MTAKYEKTKTRGASSGEYNNALYGESDVRKALQANKAHIKTCCIKGATAVLSESRTVKHRKGGRPTRYEVSTGTIRGTCADFGIQSDGLHESCKAWRTDACKRINGSDDDIGDDEARLVCASHLNEHCATNGASDTFCTAFCALRDNLCGMIPGWSQQPTPQPTPSPPTLTTKPSQPTPSSQPATKPSQPTTKPSQPSSAEPDPPSLPPAYSNSGSTGNTNPMSSPPGSESATTREGSENDESPDAAGGQSNAITWIVVGVVVAGVGAAAIALSSSKKRE